MAGNGYQKDKSATHTGMEAKRKAGGRATQRYLLKKFWGIGSIPFKETETEW